MKPTNSKNSSSQTGAAAAPASTSVDADRQQVSDLEARWPGIDLEEQRQLFARLAALRERLRQTSIKT